MKSRCIKFVAFLLCLVTAGCGSTKFPLASVAGTVTCDGAPVATAMVYLVPVQEGNKAIIGKSGQGLTKSDGTFQISTYNPGDGAVIGKHTVRVATTASTDPSCPAELSHSKVVKTIDVVAGKNSVPIELAKRNPRKKLVIADE